MTRWRTYPIVIATVLWSMWLFDVSTAGPLDRAGKVKGTDFLQFYVAGSIVREGRAGSLYDLATTHARMEAVAPGARDILYVPIQSPLIAKAAAPLAALPYNAAWLGWSAILGALYTAACVLLWRHAGRLRAYPVEAAACAIAMPAFYSTMLHGQLSAFALLLCALAFVAWTHRAPLVTGLCLGCLAFKPHWVAAALAVWLAAREWRVATGIVVAAIGQLAAMTALTAGLVVTAYIRMLRSVPAIGELLEPRPSLSLRGLASVLVTSNGAALALYACASLLVVVAAARIWRVTDRDEIRFPVMLLAMVLVSPHVLEYDLLLLAPVFVLLASWILDAPDDPSRRLVMWSLCALFFAPVLVPVPEVARVSIAVGAMLTTLATCGFAVVEISEAARERRKAIASL